jgi:23S rRNA pseudouridine1911/1915/1917 synthase
MDSPYILEETDNFAVVFKPPKMHCAPSSVKSLSAIFLNEASRKPQKNGTLLEWYSEQSLCFDIMHRLDFETHGLVLFAKNKTSYEYFKVLQDNGEFIKEYSAVCKKADASVQLTGFPEYNNKNREAPLKKDINTSQEISVTADAPFIIESYFRPFGPGRKLVRPVIEDSKKRKEIARDKGSFYRTEITAINGNIFNARINRGFRHQIRCHLCWIGFPILNDPLYSYTDSEAVLSTGDLALRAYALFFNDPANGKRCEYRISPFL